MIPCTLADQELRGGDVTRWELDVATLARWSEQPTDPRPASFDQQGRLREDPDGRAPWSAWIGFSVLLPDATPESVRATLTAWVRQHESLRSRLTLDDGSIRRRTLPADAVDVTATALGDHDAEALRALLVDEFHTRCRPSAAPAFTVCAVEVDGGHVLHAAFDHITFDGLSAYAAVGALAGLHTAMAAGLHEPHTSPSHVETTTLELAVGDGLGDDDARLRPWRDFLAGGSVPAAPAASGIDPEGRYEHDLVRHDICEGDVAATLDLRYAAEGIPTGMLWTALLMQAMGDEVHAMVSTHGRPSALWTESVGWFAGVAPFALSMPSGASSRDWVLAAVDRWRACAPAAALPLGLVRRVLDVPVAPQVVLSTIDGSRVEGHEWWRPLEGRILLGDVPPSSQTHLWLTILPEGVSLVTRLPLAPGSREWLDGVAARLARLVEVETSTPFVQQELSA